MTTGEGVAFAVQNNQPSTAAPAAKPRPQALLTSRQLDVARLVAQDLSNKQIADRLFSSERTVETHITNILNNLGLNSKTQISHWMTDLNEPALTKCRGTAPIAIPRSASTVLGAVRQYRQEIRAGQYAPLTVRLGTVGDEYRLGRGRDRCRLLVIGEAGCIPFKAAVGTELTGEQRPKLRVAVSIRR